MKKGLINIEVTLYFEQDLDPETIEDVISEVDYKFNHKLIQESKIKGIID